MSATHCGTCGGMLPGTTTNVGPFYGCNCKSMERAYRAATTPRAAPRMERVEGDAERREMLRATETVADALVLFDRKMRAAKINIGTRHMVLREWLRGFFTSSDEGE